MGRPPPDSVECVCNTTKLVVAAAARIDVTLFLGGLNDLMACLAGRFPRVETRATGRRLVEAMLSETPSKNCWTLAEHAGDKNPHVMQHFLSRASWDDTGAGEDLRDWVVN